MLYELDEDQKVKITDKLTVVPEFNKLVKLLDGRERMTYVMLMMDHDSPFARQPLSMRVKSVKDAIWQKYSSRPSDLGLDGSLTMKAMKVYHDLMFDEEIDTYEMWKDKLYKFNAEQRLKKTVSEADLKACISEEQLLKRLKTLEASIKARFSETIAPKEEEEKNSDAKPGLRKKKGNKAEEAEAVVSLNFLEREQLNE